MKNLIRLLYYFLLKPRINYRYKKTLKKLEELKNSKKGICFIVGNGPSLKIEDLELLKKMNIPTFACNKVYKLFEYTTWRPDYYLVFDANVIRKCFKEINELDDKILKFSRTVGSAKYDLKNSISLKCILFNYKWKDGLPGFLKDDFFVCGKTVTYVAIQLAVYLGYKEIYLIGCDCNYNSSDNKVNENSYPDKRMVIPNAYVNENEMIKTYISAKKYCDRLNVKIYNATRGGALEVFERVSFDDFIKKNCDLNINK